MTSTLGLLLRLTLSLAVVLGLLWLAARLVRGTIVGRGFGVLEVLARQQVGRGSAVAVLRVADRALVVGVTDAQVTLLGETDLDAVQTARDQAAVLPASGGTLPPGGALAGSVLSTDTWRRAVEALRDRTARRP